MESVPGEGPALRGQAGGPEPTGLGRSVGHADGQTCLLTAVALFSTMEIIMHSGRCHRCVGKMLEAGRACRRGEEAFRHLGSEGGLSRRHPVTLQGGWGAEGTQKDRPRGREGGA